MTTSARGFSILELLIAAAVMSTCAAALLSLVIAAQRLARIQPEAADQQQRARVAIDVLGHELAMAGAGLDRGPRAGPLLPSFAPLESSADGGLTIWYASARGGQGTLAASLGPPDTTALIDSAGTCAPSQETCGFSKNTTAILFDGRGCHDRARIDDVAASALVLRTATRGCAYAAGAAVAEGEVRTYRVDPGSRQLIRRDEATGVSAPVLDNIRAMTLEWPDGPRRVVVTLRIATTLIQLPDLVIQVDASPPNLQAR